MKASILAGSVAGLLGFGGQSLTAWSYYNSVEPEPELPPPLGPAELKFHDKKEIETFKGGICTNTYLDEEEKALLNRPGVTSQEWKNVPNKFKYPDGKAEGCVAVSWNKETWSNTRWKGSIRYEWLYKIGEETLVVYGVYNPDDMLVRTSWRAIYINRKQKRSAWNLWFPEKTIIPKSPVFLGGWMWGFNPVWGLACNWPGNVCDGEPKTKTFNEIKWTWKEDDKGDQLFTDWSRNFWDAFKSLIYDSQNPLTALIDLTKREGTWSRR